MNVDSDSGSHSLHSRGSRTSSYIDYFDLSDDKFPWRDSRPQEIEHRRALLTDALIFDELLRAGGIHEPDVLYPPRDVSSLERLLDTIEGCQFDVVKKECLVYYLLKWYDDDRATQYRKLRGLLPQYRAMVDAYFALDTGVDVAEAVSILSDSRLTPDYASKIILAIRQEPNSTRLVLQYVRCTKPSLTEPDDLELYTIALAENNLLEAWQYQRTYHERDEMRPRLFKCIMDWCVSPKPKAEPLRQFLALPLSQYEQTLLHEHALHPPEKLSSTSLATLQHLICVRLIQSGKYADAIKMDRMLSSQSPLKEHTADRSKMIQELHSVLSPTERALLNVELEQLFKATPAAANTTNMAGVVTHDAAPAHAWEEMRAPPPTSKSSGTPARPLSSSRGTNGLAGSAPRTPMADLSTPRFGGAISSILPPTSSAFNSSLRASTNTRPAVANAALSASTLGSRTPVQAITGKTRNNILGSSTASNPFGSSTATNPFNSSVNKAAPSNTGAFVSANKQQNAFFQPANGTGRKSMGGTNEISTRLPSPPPAPASDEEMNSDGTTTEIDEPQAGNDQAESSLSFSVFGAPLPASASQEPSASAGRKRNTPQEDQSMEMEDLEGPPSRRTRGAQKNASSNLSAATSASASASAGPSTRRTRASTKSASAKVLPGGFAIDEDGDSDDTVEQEEEKQDDIAPLPALSKKRARRPTAKALAGISASDVSSEDGGDSAPRRRSSRLSHAPSNTKGANESTSGVKKSAAKPRKSAAATSKATTRKKRS